MIPILFFLIILIAATGPVLSLFSALRLRFDNDLEKGVFAAAAGLGFLAYAVFTVGSLGFLRKDVFLVLIGLAALAGWKPVRECARGSGKLLLDDWKKCEKSDRFLLGLCLLVGILALSGALAPAVGQDELCYHLQQPKNYVREGRIYNAPFSANALWPYLMEMLFTLGVLLQGDGLAKLFHFTAYALTGAALYAGGRRLAGASFGRTAAFFYLLTPAVFLQAGFAYVDNALALYFFLFFHAFYCFLRTRQTTWAFLAGLFAGFLVSTKLIGLFVLPIAAGWAAWEWLRNASRKNLFEGFLLFASTLVVSGSLWYIRSALFRGNPFFPFFPEYFEGQGWTDTTYIGAHGGEGFLGFLHFPWDLTMRPERYGGESIGPAFLLFAPLALLARPLSRDQKAALAIFIAYAAVWFIFDPNVRFFFPALALLSLLAARGVKEAGRWGKPLLAVVLALQAAFASYHFADEAALFFQTGEGPRESYLAEREPSYVAAKKINAALGPGEKILSLGENRGYYFDKPFVLEGDFQRFTHYDTLLSSEKELAFTLKSMGFTHVLTSDTQGEPQKEDGPFRLTRVLTPGCKSSYFDPLLTIDTRIAPALFKTPSRTSVHYVLHKIRAPHE